MADLNSDIQVTIDSLTRAPSRAGFGTACVMAFHTHWPERIRRYASTTAMISDGFLTDEPATLLAGKLFGQQPNSVAEIVLGREINTGLKSMQMTPILSLLEGLQTYTIYVNGVAVTTAAMLATPTVADCCTKLKTAIDAESFTGMTVTDNTTDIELDVAAAANNFYMYAEDFRVLTLKDNTVDAGGASGIAQDIADVIDADNDWYEVHLTNQAESPINAASTFIQSLSNTNKKKLAVTSQDSDIPATAYSAGVTTDVASDLKTAGNGRTHIAYHYRGGDQFMTGAWSGNILPLDPGKSTYKFWELTGTDVMNLTDTEISNIQSKSCNLYILKGGLGCTQQGVACDGEFIDITRDTDFIVARIQEGIYGLLANSDKVPYDDDGGTQLQGEVDAVLRLGVKNTIFRADPAPTTSVPKVSTIDTTDRALRHFPDVKGYAEYAGAIHSVGVALTVSV